MLKKLKEKFRAFLPEKWPSLQQCKRFFDFLSDKERSIFQIASTLFLVSLIVFLSVTYLEKTVPAPAFGGRYIEGIIGRPQLLNPIYSSANDTDRDISEILFSKIAKEDSGEIVSDLALDISSQDKIFEITLKDNLFWSDGEKITSDDIIFTIETIQDPKTRSPLRPAWIGIKVEKVSDLKVRFHLEEESSVFLNRLASFQPIPKHIWENVPLDSFSLSNYNLNPVNSGPYRLKSIKKDSLNRIESISLEINPYYHGERANIEEVSFRFFDSLEEMISFSRRGNLDGFAAINPADYQLIKEKTRFVDHSFQIPRVFSLFFNLDGDSDLIKDVEFRKALNLAIDKETLIEKVLDFKGEAINSAVLSEVYGFDFQKEDEFDLEKANSILDNLGLFKNEFGIREKLLREERTFEFKNDLSVGSQGSEVRELQKCLIDNDFLDADVTGFYGSETKDAVIDFQEYYKEEILIPAGFSKGTGMVSKSTQAKLNELCQFTPAMKAEAVFVLTTVDQPLMIKTAQEIRSQLQMVGIEIEISLLDISSLESRAIKSRDYQILLFGKAFEIIPDPFPFWHSSQKTEHGFNLSMYANDSVDSLVEEIRQESSQEERIKLLERLDNLLERDLPAIFLFNPDYILFTSSKIKGISPDLIFNPSQRFKDINNWYIKTKRIKR